MTGDPIIAACIITNAVQQTLLLRREDRLWELPNAPTRCGESPQDAAKRAVRQSTGLTGEVSALIGVVAANDATQRAAQHVFGFQVSTNPAPIVPVQPTLDWFHNDNLPGVTPELASFLRQHAAGRQYLPRTQWLATTPRSWTCTAAIITTPDGRLLLVKAAGASFWNFPGGMIDAHETGPQGAARELCEETGLDLPAGRLLTVTWQHPEPGLDYPIIQFFHDFGSIDPSELIFICHDGEIIDWQWFHENELEAATGSKRAELARQALSARHSAQVGISAVSSQSAHSLLDPDPTT